MSETPIACSLDAQGQRERFARGTALAAEALLDQRHDPQGATLSFAAAPGVEERLRDLVAAEARCCPFLEFALERRTDSIEVRVEGPPEARPILLDLFGLSHEA